MIKRSYFYSGTATQHNIPDTLFSGIVSITTFFPQPEIARKEVMKNLENSVSWITGKPKINIKVMNKI